MVNTRIIFFVVLAHFSCDVLAGLFGLDMGGNKDNVKMVNGTPLAEYTEFELHLTSYHFDDSSDFENDNHGIGVTHYYKDRWGISVGGYNNSYDDTSLYLGLVYTNDLCSSDTLTCAVGAIGGVVTGYENNIDRAGDVWPIVLPEFKLGYEQYFIKSRFFPDLGSNASAAITLSVGREF